MDETESPQPASASTDAENRAAVVEEPTPDEEPKEEVKEEEDPSLSFSHANLEASSAPPLQLLNSDSELSGELTGASQAILVESSEKAVTDVAQSEESPLKEDDDEPGDGEPMVDINIEDQLKEFDGSDDETTDNKESHEPIENLVDALCDSESSKLGIETVDATVEEEASQNESTDKDAFEEVDMSEVEKEKASATEENDVLSDDRTQLATGSGDAKGDQTDYEDNESRTESRTESRMSRMEVDGEEPDEHVDEQPPEEIEDPHDGDVQEEDEDVSRDEGHGDEEGDTSHHPDDDSAIQADGDADIPVDSNCERITPNNDDDEEENHENADNNENDINNETLPVATSPIPGNNGEADDPDSVHDEQSNDKANEKSDEVINDVEMSETTNEVVADDSVAEQMDVCEEISDNTKEVETVEKPDETERPASNPRSRGRSSKPDNDTGSANLDDSKSRSKTRISRRLSPETIMENNKDKNDMVKPRTRAKTMDGSHERPNLSHHASRSKQPSVDETEDAENTEHAEHVELKELQIKELADDFPNEKCNRCRKTRSCQYKYMQDGEVGFLCSLKCTSSFRALHKETFHLIARKIPISLVFDVSQNCHLCKSRKSCRYRLKQPDDETQSIYLCGPKCYDSFIGMNVEKFYKRRKTYLVQEVSSDVAELEKKCIRCSVSKKCLYSFRDDDNVVHFICEDACFEVLEKEEENRLKLKRRSVRVRDLGIPPEIPTHAVSAAVANPASVAAPPAEPRNLTRTEEEAEQARFDREASLVRRCGACYMIIKSTRLLLEWETFPFCNDTCLEKYQNLIGSNCTNCNSLVSSTSMGKYCVRFGFEVRQFCSSHCLDTYKKRSIKECAHCQKDISHDKDGFLAPVGDKSQFKDFCSTSCVKKYEDILNPRKKQNTGNCAVCNLDKLVRVDLTLDSRGFEFCSNPCFSAFKFVNNIAPDQCTLCMKYFERNTSNAHTLYEDNVAKIFCSRICLTVFISMNRKIVSCQWCKVKKYNFDMILRQNVGLTTTLCSTTCLRKYLGPGSINATSSALVVRLQKICDQCLVNCNPTFSLAMSDSTSRNFCTQQCVIDFQAIHKRPINDSAKTSAQKNKQAPYPIGLPKKLHPKADKSIMRPVQLGQSSPASASSSLPLFSTNLSVSTATQSSTVDSEPLLPPQAQSPEFGLPATKRRGRHKKTLDLSFDHHDSLPPMTPSPPVVRPVKKRSIGVNTIESGPIKAQIITVPPPQPQMVNKQTMCQPSAEALAMQASRPTCTVELQTDDSLERKYFVPVPVPMYVPQPMAMYSMPFPVPVPIPIPIPVPIFIPTTRNTASGIMKEIKKIQDKMPADPFEAELLMMAEMVADEKRNESDSEPEDAVEDTSVVEYAPEGDDIFQMDLNISTGYDEPPNVDIENSMPANAIQQVTPTLDSVNDYMSPQQQMMMMEPQRRLMSSNARKRAASPPTPTARGRLSTTPPNKRQRSQPQQQQQQQIISSPIDETIRSTTEPAERPDANMCLKYTFGVNAWRQWVMNKNADLEKSTIRRKSFKTELLQLTADELNYSLCLFVKEVRKPNGSEYAPDTIYYLVLGIQQYLYENGRIDNIFTDPYYERFTDCLDDVARKFSVLYNDSQYIVTRVEEEHLWECKQLGAHSPHVLLSTLMFFNTKHFNLTTVDEHMQLSFSHIMKHWKRNNQSGKQNQSTRNVLLRFYPPQTTPDNPRKKKVYEQQENENNPLRCPVKLYEFYLSKCPESVKTRSDVFYLQPERSCVPDSPVWYSTQALSRESLNKMLHRVKMVKEINVALLSSQ